MAETVIKLGDPEKMKRTIVRRAYKRAAADALSAVVDRLEKRIDAEIAKRLDKAFDSQIEAVARRIVEAPVQRTNSYGQPVGEPKTLFDHLTEEARKALTCAVDYNGNISRDSYSKETKFLDYAVKKVADKWLKETFTAELDKAVYAVKEQVIAGVIKAAAEAVEKHAKKA